ncbi:glycerol kinase [Salmonella enterica subsp. enterica]|uniref:Glycerol kinase n=1 Tax=Salmonella enterica I TaxID=59201 RepID=A0A447TQT4_SALET|nr:glycerol kinase [Salmonella enterica subsp. enterica]
MTEKKYIVALDQGTTSSRAVVMDHDANIVSVSQREFEQIYPKPGWVEHEPDGNLGVPKLNAGRSAG